MNLETVFETVCQELPKAHVKFLMIGGHAVNYYGYIRATMDVDFMIATDAVSVVRKVMKNAGFSNISEGENVILFNHPNSSIRVDFLPIDNATMTSLLKNSVNANYSGFSIQVPSLEDLIAMKLFASKNPKRKERDLADIVQLFLENEKHSSINLKSLCDRFSNQEIFQELTIRIEESRHA